MKTALGGLKSGMGSRSGIHRLGSSALGHHGQVADLEVLVAHDVRSQVCDGIVTLLEQRGPRPPLSGLPVTVGVTRASSVHDAGELLRSRRFDLVVVSLDLQPAPRAAARLADHVLAQGTPVVLVTRSLRWLPPDAAHLRLLPWVAPEAGPDDLGRAFVDALTGAPFSARRRKDDAGVDVLAEADAWREDEGDRVSLGF
jgi:hypothetical protein